MTAVATVPSVTGRAEAILRQVAATAWPSSDEARGAIGYAAGRAAECAVIHARLQTGDMDWEDFDPDLEFSGDPQAAAAALAGDEALEAARAALRLLREHQRREAAGLAYANSTEGGKA